MGSFLLSTAGSGLLLNMKPGLLLRSLNSPSSDIGTKSTATHELLPIAGWIIFEFLNVLILQVLGNAFTTTHSTRCKQKGEWRKQRRWTTIFCTFWPRVKDKESRLLYKFSFWLDSLTWRVWGSTSNAHWSPSRTLLYRLRPREAEHREFSVDLR